MKKMNSIHDKVHAEFVKTANTLNYPLSKDGKTVNIDAILHILDEMKKIKGVVCICAICHKEIYWSDEYDGYTPEEDSDEYDGNEYWHLKCLYDGR